MDPEQGLKTALQAVTQRLRSLEGERTAVLSELRRLRLHSRPHNPAPFAREAEALRAEIAYFSQIADEISALLQ